LKEAYVALGANLGEREQSLRQAIDRLRNTSGIEMRRISAVYETEPVGYTDQPAFLNMAAAIGTEFAPADLLWKLLEIEKDMGRVRDIRWGPRTIDLDLLLYEDVSLETEELTLPHPRMGERAFVLVPLRDVWPIGLKFPWQTAINALQPEETGIRKWGVLDKSR
jgi:2-amino-4-hydroxy-6-hydroxymethyldihydropteridine diphosphokinase